MRLLLVVIQCDVFVRARDDMLLEVFLEILPFHICLCFDVYFSQTHCDFCLSRWCCCRHWFCCPEQVCHTLMFLAVFITRKNVSFYSGNYFDPFSCSHWIFVSVLEMVFFLERGKNCLISFNWIHKNLIPHWWFHFIC